MEKLTKWHLSKDLKSHGTPEKQAFQREQQDKGGILVGLRPSTKPIQLRGASLQLGERGVLTSATPQEAPGPREDPSYSSMQDGVSPQS